MSLAKGVSLRKVARHVFWIVSGLALFYLVAANLLLQTRLLRDLVSKGPDLELSYETAYSLWPGRATFRGLRLTAQDYNVQFAVHVASGVVDVSLHELFLRRFHALHLNTHGTVFRFRHKVVAIGDNADRLAAYPPIDGYSDPALYVGAKTAPIAESDYDLWEIALEDVDAELAELWFLEHRYLGEGRAQGGFWLRPGRWFEVYPATLELRGATYLGSEAFASQVVADIWCRIEKTDVTQEAGIGMLRSISARVALQVLNVDAAVARVYLPPHTSAAGWVDVRASLAMTRGVPDVDSRMDVVACPFAVRTENDHIEGSVNAHVQVHEAGTLDAQVNFPELLLGPLTGHKPLVAVEPSLRARFEVRDVTEALVLEELAVSVPKLEVPSLGVVNGWLGRSGSSFRLSGRLDGEAQVRWRPKSLFEGHAKLRVVGGGLETPDFRSKFSGLASVSLAPGVASPEKTSSTGHAAFELDTLQLGKGKREGAPFRIDLRSSDLRVALEPRPRLSATWQISAEPADEILPFLIGAPVLEGLAAGVLDLDRLDAKTQLVFDERFVSLTLARAESGALEAKGFWQRSGRGKGKGAFLLTTKVANLGLSLDGSAVETDLFAPDDWLSQRQD